MLVPFPVAVTVGKAKWKPVKLPLPGKIVKGKQYCIPGGMAEIRATIKELKEAGAAIPVTFPFSLSIWPVQKTNETLENDGG